MPEEAFNFYKQVFLTEFHGNAIQRFGDISPIEGQPPLSEDNKSHSPCRTPILGGYILMATVAPESMGFKVLKGYNIHVDL